MMRFSIRSIFAFCVIAGVFFAAFHYATELWAQLLSFAALSVICYATIVAKFGPTSTRAYWGSFAFVGGVYFLLSFVLHTSTQVFPTNSLVTFLCYKLTPYSPGGVVNGYAPPVTAYPPAYTYIGPSPSLAPTPPPGAAYAAPPPGALSRGAGVQYNSVIDYSRLSARVQIGHCAITLLLAWIGAWVGRWAWKRRLEQDSHSRAEVLATHSQIPAAHTRL